MNGRSCVPETGQVGFADLVLADQGWLTAEFDAIIAANFGTASEYRPWFTQRGPSGGFRGPDRSAGPRTSPGTRAAHRVDPRERSPPPRRIDGG
ncbi:hypothetical protein [Saccharothrix deserti]|uniref:hypothetical protein n=1 Tax=Saccharothrix deserti TaxID=2593674 RepID=UPI00131D079A|nr:hypothetical protein [Saccharothrix deserti]